MKWIPQNHSEEVDKQVSKEEKRKEAFCSFTLHSKLDWEARMVPQNTVCVFTAVKFMHCKWFEKKNEAHCLLRLISFYKQNARVQCWLRYLSGLFRTFCSAVSPSTLHGKTAELLLLWDREIIKSNFFVNCMDVLYVCFGVGDMHGWGTDWKERVSANQFN